MLRTSGESTASGLLFKPIFSHSHETERLGPICEGGTHICAQACVLDYPQTCFGADTASGLKPYAYSSLQSELGDGLTLEQTVGDEGMEEYTLERIALREAVNRLPERERQVIELRYFRGMTQEKAAQILGVSQVQVSRIEHKAVERLRNKLSE